VRAAASAASAASDALAAFDVFEAARPRTAADRLASERDLVDAVRDMDAAGESAAVLELLALRPHLVPRLDVAVRRTDESRYGYHAPGARRTTAPPLADDLNPLGLALASGDPDGRVRALAVARLHDLLRRGRAPVTLMPFLVLRTADWADPVRQPARAALALLLHDDPARLVPAAAPVTLLVAQRDRGAFAERQLLGALAALPGSAVLDQLLSSPDPHLRRFVLRAALATRRLPLRTLVAITERDADRRCRELAAEAAVRDAVWAEQDALLRRLAASRYPEVRLLGLVGLVRRGLVAQAVPHLADPSSLVRAVARDAARRTGVDALAWYRTAVRPHGPGPTGPGGAGAPVPGAGAAHVPGAIAGLTESGRAEDAALLVPLLAHPRSRVRAAAVRGLRVLDAVPVDDVVPLLRDPSAKVVREAVAALRTHTGRLPAGLAQSLLAHPDRPAVRRAGYRLLDEPDVLARLRTTLEAAADPDPRLGRSAAADAAALIRGFHPSPWRARTPDAVPVLDPSPEQRRELLALAEAAAPRLHHRSRQLLWEHLDTAAPSAELLRVRYGPHPDTVNPMPELRATFAARDPGETVDLIREVLLTVLSFAARPAHEGPDDRPRPDVLPDWFVQHVARSSPGSPGSPGADAAADGQLPDWFVRFVPDRVPDRVPDVTPAPGIRDWRWWHAGVDGHGTGWIRFGTLRRPYAGRAALLRLIEAAGGHDIHLP
jgi:hypothetical protein